MGGKRRRGGREGKGKGEEGWKEGVAGRKMVGVPVRKMLKEAETVYLFVFQNCSLSID